MEFNIIVQPPNTLILNGRFIFSCHSEFTQQTTKLLIGNPDIKTLILDLSGLEYIDSSGLGLLLVLRDKTEAKKIEIILRQPKKLVLDILNVVKFNRLFTIKIA